MAPERRSASRSPYRALIGLYPRSFREQLGESMEQTFVDIRNEQRGRSVPQQVVTLLWLFAEAAIGALKEHAAMGTRAARPLLPALLALLLCLPMVTVIVLALLNVEPHVGPLQPLVTDEDGRISGAIPIGFLLLVPLAFLVVLVPIVRSIRAGRSSLAHRTNVAVAAMIFAGMLAFTALFAIDQYPCWVGVPNCD